MRTFMKENSLSLVFGALFVATLVGQAFAGRADYNNQQIADGLVAVSLSDYVTSADFAVDITENWQSEYLQFFLYVTLTVWLIQKGSPESKPPGSEGRESDKQQKVGAYATPESPRLAALGGLATKLYSRSLGLVMSAIFLVCWLAQSVAGWASYNERRLSDLQEPLTWAAYVGSADFWSRTCRTGSPSFSPSGRWRCSVSTCVSAGPPRASRQDRPTTPPVSRPERATPQPSRVS
jgi:hypothetical protein